MPLELTPIENIIKHLLLDVAQYVHTHEIDVDDVKILDHRETVLRFTGGWVRDKLLGIDSHDLDVGISSMTGYQFGMALKQYLDVPKNLEKYKQLRPGSVFKEEIVSLHKIAANPEKSKHLETVTTRIFGFDVDLVNLRKETYSQDSRNPQMEFGTATEDALRRDATVNALFYNLNTSALEDLTGRGLEDMRNKLIRTPLAPYQTFRDDPLRVLRLIRFASRLGYRIDKDTEDAMHNKGIGASLKLKISRERVGSEITRMLEGILIIRALVKSILLPKVPGPDPRSALHFIDLLGLYSTIFANYQDDAAPDTSTWSLAYDSLEALLRPSPADDTDAVRRVRNVLTCNASETYYTWVITAFAPWSSMPTRTEKTPKAKRFLARAAEVARDSLRAGNRTIAILNNASNHFEDVIFLKDSLLGDALTGTASELRQTVGLSVRAWGHDWRLCVLLAILQEVMRGDDFLKGMHRWRSSSTTDTNTLF